VNGSLDIKAIEENDGSAGASPRADKQNHGIRNTLNYFNYTGEVNIEIHHYDDLEVDAGRSIRMKAFP